MKASHLHNSAKANRIRECREEVEDKSCEPDHESVLRFIVEKEDIVEVTLGKNDFTNQHEQRD